MEFEPDPEGNNVDFAANLATIEFVNRVTDENGKRLELRRLGKDCGCHQCVTDLNLRIADNADRASWVAEKEKWGKTLVTTKKKHGRR